MDSAKLTKFLFSFSLKRLQKFLAASTFPLLSRVLSRVVRSDLCTVFVEPSFAP